MSFLSWEDNIHFDPHNTAVAIHGIPVPTYGNYGGPGYSAGGVGGTTPEPPPTPQPVDQLDELFYQHDLVYQRFSDGKVTYAQTL